MRRLYRAAAALTLAALLSTTAGCDSENQYGKCVGIGQDDQRNPNMYYEISVWNVFWGVIGIELIFPPILVLAHETYCPSGPKPASRQPSSP